MKSLHILSSLNKSSGGTSLSSYTLVKGLQMEGLHADMVTFSPKDENEEMISTEDFIHTIPPSKIPKWEYSNIASNYIKDQLTKYDLFHLHGIWEFLPHQAAITAYKARKPYLITVSGMLYPAALQSKPLFKKVAARLFQDKDLNQATVLQATCYQEYEYIRAYGLKNPVAVIANPLELPPNLPNIIPSAEPKIRVGFMGRFNPIKNIDVLIDAWSKVNKDNPDQELELVLIGDGEKSYREALQKQVQHHGLTNVSFVGFLNGDEKEEMLTKLNYLVLPSKSENFGMVVTEALLRGIPVIASKGTPWGDLEEYKCGWWVENDLSTLASAIEKAICLEEKARVEMGQRGQDLVVEKYGQSAVALQMKELYAWMLDRKLPKPDTVYLN
jgi:glycosyltransferase involved in cell wall biosynthesis